MSRLRPALRYHFTLAPDARSLTTTLCFDGARPTRLTAPVADAAAHLRSVERLTTLGASMLQASADGIALDTLAAGDCVRYVVDLALEAGPLQPFGVRSHDGAEGVASTRLWLWVPEPLAPDADLRARFDGADGRSVSLPWRLGDNNVWHLDATAFTREGYVAWSVAPGSTVATGDGTLWVHRVDGARGADAWLGRSARVVAGLYGGFPAPWTQVILLGRAQGDGADGYSDAAVPFAFTSHAAGESVMFMLWRDATAEGVARDTTALHEFVHLGQPVMRDEDAWLVEGIATYYEKVLAVRGGFTDERAAWSWYLDGFVRGRDDSSGRTLAEDSAALYVDHHVSRVYWAGVAFAMMADVAVRRETQGRRSLDDAVRALRSCCYARARTFTADEALAAMDAAVGSPSISRLAGAVMAARDFPDVESTLAALGVRRGPDEVTLDDRAPAAAVRAAVFAAPGR